MVGPPMVGHPQELIWVLHYLGRAPMVAREPIGWGGSLGAGVLTGSWIPPSEWDSRVAIHPVIGGGGTHGCPQHPWVPPLLLCPPGMHGRFQRELGALRLGAARGLARALGGGAAPPGGAPAITLTASVSGGGGSTHPPLPSRGPKGGGVHPTHCVLRGGAGGHPKL